jgi:hypothetical protein
MINGRDMLPVCDFPRGMGVSLEVVQTDVHRIRVHSKEAGSDQTDTANNVIGKSSMPDGSSLESLRGRAKYLRVCTETSRLGITF